MRKLFLIPATLVLASCGTADAEPQTVPPPPVETTPGPITSTPESELPEPVTSPPPTDAPKILDTTATVRNLEDVDPALAEEYGFLPTKYFPVLYDPSLYCSVEDINVCGTSEELLEVFMIDITPELEEIQREAEDWEYEDAPAEEPQVIGPPPAQ